MRITYLSFMVFCTIISLFVLNYNLFITKTFKPGLSSLVIYNKLNKFLVVLLFGAFVFMFSLNRYSKTGNSPILENITNLPQTAIQFVNQAVNQAYQNTVNKTIFEVQNITNFNNENNSCNFISGNNINDLFFDFFDSFLRNFGFMFKPAPVSGYLDDLIGQQIAVEFILLFATISLILLIIAYIFNNLLIYNKDYIINRFGKNNKFVKLYLNYQVFCIKASLYYLPIFMFIGFYVLIHGLHFLITHQIPLDSLGLDLHILVKSN